MTTDRPVSRATIYTDIDHERERQQIKWGRAHAWGKGDCSSRDVSLPAKMAVLTEEVGEVARAILEFDRGGLRDELVQVAAVAIAILEGMDSER